MKRLGFIAATVVCVVGIVGSANATPSTKLYTTSFAPMYAPIGAAATDYLLRLTNCGPSTCARSSNQTLGSANFDVPQKILDANGGTITVSLDSAPTAGWTAGYDAATKTVQFRSGGSKDALSADEFVQAKVHIATPPAASACFPYAWTSHVKQSNDFSGTGNDYTLSGADALLTISKLAFEAAGQPPTAVQSGSPFSATATAEDGCGNTLAAATGNVSIALGANPTSTALGGTTSQALSSGSATFSDLVVNPPATGYTLVASLTNFSSGTSRSFDVVQLLCSGHTCHSQDDPGTTIADAAAPPHGASLGLGFNQQYAGFSCTGVATRIGSFVVIDPSNYGANTFNVTLTFKKSISGSNPANQFVLCVSKDGGVTFRPVGLCGSPAVAPCIVSRKRTTGGDLQVVLFLDQNDPPVGGGFG